MKPFTSLQATLIGGAVGGLGDILFAIAFAAYNGTAPMKLLQTVASGALGQSAFDGGMSTALLGLALHFLLSFGWAALLVVAARNIPGLLKQPVLAAIGYGVLVFLVMRLVVLPLSAFPFPVRFRPLSTVLDGLSHIVLFALPMVWAARRIKPAHHS